MLIIGFVMGKNYQKNVLVELLISIRLKALKDLDVTNAILTYVEIVWIFI